MSVRERDQQGENHEDGICYAHSRDGDRLPALAQRAQSAPQQGYQQNGYYNGYPLSEWYRTDEW